MTSNNIFQFLAFSFCLIYLESVSAEQHYQLMARNFHNKYRSQHRVANLHRNDDLHLRASLCAQYYAEKGYADNSCPYKNGAGENFWYQQGGPQLSNIEVAQQATNFWYSKHYKHDYNLDWQPATVTFSQLVWKRSTQMGFGVGRNGNLIVACALYNPAGNIYGQFRQNVFHP